MKLNVTESLILLGLDDQTGKFRSMPNQAFAYALTGAVIAELELKGYIALSERLVEVISNEQAPVEKELELALGLLPNLAHPNLQNVIASLAANAGEFKRLVLERLVSHEILRKDEEDFLWVFHSERYETLDLTNELAVRDRLRHVILDVARNPTPEESVLVALMDVCRLDGLLLSHAEIEHAEERIRSIATHDSIGNMIQETVVDLQRFALQYPSYSGF